MDVQHSQAEAGDRANGSGDRIGYVMELRIKENRQAQLVYRRNTPRTIGGEEFEPELKATDVGPHAGRQCHGVIEARRV